MKDKERLLSFDTPLAFIFSHSALKEGWDNPNVFQICTLRDIHSENERRQTIGRGLRLCVDQTGARVRGFDPNTLTVIATESYERFAAGLQKEIEDATGTPFANRIEIRNADERRKVKPRHAVLASAEFKALWERIKFKTTFRANFDNEHMIRDCIRELREAPEIPRARLQWRIADLEIGRSGIGATERAGSQSVSLGESGVTLPDILTELEERTALTRRTIRRVLSESERLRDFERNPQAFIELAASAMLRCKRAAIVDGIQYLPLGNDYFYAQELLDHETAGYVRRMIADAEHKSAYDHIVYDSEIEAAFVNRLENESSVKQFVKLPAWFEIPTPLGAYNPDWAVVVEVEGRERMYFVAETKGSIDNQDLRGAEAAKIKCGRAHYDALRVMENPARYVVVTTVQDLLNGAE